MLGLKQNKLIMALLLAVLSTGYFSGFSQVELIAPLKGYVAIVPLQIAALIYGLMFLRSNRRLTQPNENQQRNLEI